MPTTKMDTRLRILDAAQRIVVHKGFAAVGINEVLVEAGVPKGSFYYLFNSKDAFGEAMLRSYFADYLANMDRIFADGDRSAAERLMRYWQNFHDAQSADECQGRCLAVKLGAEVSDLSEVMRVALKEGTAGMVDRVEQMIISGLAEGSLAIDASPRLTAEALYDAWLGASVMAKIQRNRDSLDRAMTITRQFPYLSGWNGTRGSEQVRLIAWGESQESSNHVQSSFECPRR